MIEIFRDYRHIQLHLKAFARICSFKVIKVMRTSPEFQSGCICYKRCASAEATLHLSKDKLHHQPDHKSATDRFRDLQ